MHRWIAPALVVAGSSLGLHAQDLRATAAARAACGAQDTTFNVDAVPAGTQLSALDPARAVVYVIEQESSTPGICFGRCGGLTLKVGIDGQWIGAVNGSSYLVAQVDPGQHHLCANWQSHVKKLSEKVALNGFTAEAGHVYYFLTHDVATTPEAGSLANITLEPADPDEAKMLLEAYPRVQATAKK